MHFLGSFVFFVMWSVGYYLLNVVAVAMPSSGGDNIINTVHWAFGIICAIFFVTGIILVFVLDSLSEEPEIYYRR